MKVRETNETTVLNDQGTRIKLYYEIVISITRSIAANHPPSSTPTSLA